MDLISFLYYYINIKKCLSLEGMKNLVRKLCKMSFFYERVHNTFWL